MVVALGLQIALPRFPAAVRPAVVVLSYVTVGAWTLVNVRGRPVALRLAFVLLAAGWALNLLAIAPNGGMPVSRAALAEIGAPATFEIERGNLSKHVASSSSSTFGWLGDTIPVRPVHSVISIGDLVLAAGIVLFLGYAPTSERQSASRARTSAGFIRSVDSGTPSTMARCSQ